MILLTLKRNVVFEFAVLANATLAVAFAHILCFLSGILSSKWSPAILVRNCRLYLNKGLVSTTP